MANINLHVGKSNDDAEIKSWRDGEEKAEVTLKKGKDCLL